MTSKTQSPLEGRAGPIWFDIGQVVATPAGNHAAVIAKYAVEDGGWHSEVLVEYPSGERARFRAKLLRALP